MEWYQLLLRFALGGTMVVGVTVVASASRNSYLAGIAASFPTVLVASAIALKISGFDAPFISRFFLGTLFGLAVIPAFSLSAWYLVRQWGFVGGVAGALAVWIVLASLVALRVVWKH